MYAIDKWDENYLSEKEGEAAIFGETARQGLDDAIQHTKQLLEQVPLYDTFVSHPTLSSPSPLRIVGSMCPHAIARDICEVFYSAARRSTDSFPAMYPLSRSIA